MLSLENELIKITVLLDKGADIIDIVSKKRDVDFLWKKPGGIRETSKYILSTPSDSGNFEDYYAGGWQEVLPGGGPCKYKGANLGLHGETALLPWGFKVIHDAHDEVVITSYSIHYTKLYDYELCTLKSYTTCLDAESKHNAKANAVRQMLSKNDVAGALFELNQSCEIPGFAESALFYRNNFV